MAVLLTVMAIALGTFLGMSNGGRFDRVTRFRPDLWQVGVAGIALQFIIAITGVSGGLAVVIELLSAAALLAFAVANIRLGGMVLVGFGLVLNLIPTLINRGTPTSLHALERAGLLEASDRASVVLDGPRHVATSNDTFRFLGEVIATPTGNVISFGDGFLLVGYILVISSLLRGRWVKGDAMMNYRERIAPLGNGPLRNAARRPRRVRDSDFVDVDNP